MAWSDDDKASALAALDANGGNVSTTSRQTGVPRATLTEWSQGRYTNRQVSENRQIKKDCLADMLEDLARQMIGAARDKVVDASLKDTMVSVGVSIDKMQLLRNEPTEITTVNDSISDEDLDRRIAALEAGEVAAA